MIHYLVPRSQAFSVVEYLDFWGERLAGTMRVVHYEELPARMTLPAGTWILSALDQLSPAMTRLLAEVERQLAESGRVRVLNSSARTLTRLPLLNELHRLGINAFLASNAADSSVAELRFPVFVREEHGHGGALVPLLRSPRELDSALRRLAWRGWRRDQLLVVEYFDTADAAGFYRKYAAFIVGDRIIPRSLAHGPHWMLKHRSGVFTRDTLEEERAYVEENPHAAELAEIARIAGVEWGRIDYTIKDGVPVVWEINLNPTIGRGRRPSSGSVPPELRPLRDVARERFYRDFLAALEAVDTVPALGDIVLSLPPALMRVGSVLRTSRPTTVPPVWIRLGRPLRTLAAAFLRPRRPL